MTILEKQYRILALQLRRSAPSTPQHSPGRPPTPAHAASRQENHYHVNTHRNTNLHSAPQNESKCSVHSCLSLCFFTIPDTAHATCVIREILVPPPDNNTAALLPWRQRCHKVQSTRIRLQPRKSLFQIVIHRVSGKQARHVLRRPICTAVCEMEHFPRVRICLPII